MVTMNPPNTQHITIDINIERIVLVKFKQYCKNSQKLVVGLTENQKKDPFVAILKNVFSRWLPQTTDQYIMRQQ